MATDELTKQEEKSFRQELFQQLITLSTSGFGLVAALAWNEAIQSFVHDFIQPYFSSEYGVLSKLLYALLITGFAVLITYQLSRLAARFSSK